MKIFYSDSIVQPLEQSVVTVGSYDGLHYGHRVLLRAVTERARQLGLQSVVVTFAPHPRQVLPADDRVALLNSLPEKVHLLREAGVDCLFVIRFDREFAQMPYDRFVRDVLIRTVGMKYMVLGYNHHFGNNRQGNFTSIDELSAQFGFTAERIARYDFEGGKVSSTVVRRLIADGDMAAAQRLLTRPYLLIADVEADGVLAIAERDKLLPPAGVYPVRVSQGESRTDAALEVRTGQPPMLLERCAAGCRDVLIEFLTPQCE